MATATKKRSFGGSSLGGGWSSLMASDTSAAPADPQETRLSATLLGPTPRFVSQDRSFAIWNATREQPDGSTQGVTLKGPLARCSAGEMLNCTGRWKRHPQHGWSFLVDAYESALPTTPKGIVDWLQGNVPGVGPTFAQAIVDHFGHERVYELIDENPERLREVRTKKGRAISGKQVEAAIEAWDEVKAIRQIDTFLFSHGVKAGMADKLYRQYGEHVVTVLQSEPYRITEIPGIGFAKADEIALAMGVDLNDPMRIREGLLYVLHEAEGEGHTFMYVDDLFKKVSAPRDTPRARDKGLGVSDRRGIGEQATELVRERRLFVEEAQKVDKHGDTAKTQRVYSRRMYETEKRLARKLRELLQPPAGPLFPPPTRPTAPANATKEEVDSLGLPSDDQWSVVEQVRTNRLSILTGGPGVGKSHSLSTVVGIAKSAGRKVELCAPTGKAARRMSELTGEPAQTIHRLLEFSQEGFLRDEGNPITADLIVLDEASMLALDLADHFFSAVGPETHVLLVGDPDQLPPVGAGKVLDDVITSEAVPRTHLTKVFRQAASSMIVTNARLINSGASILPSRKEAEQALQRNMLEDFFFIGRKQDPDDPEAVHKKIREDLIDMVCNRIPRTFKTAQGQPMDPVKDIMVLAPMRKGPLGLDILNKELEAKLNAGPDGLPKKPILPASGICVGSRIMQTKNDYRGGNEAEATMNGEVGIVLDYSDTDSMALVSVDDGAREIWLPTADMDRWVLAWASSIHRSQGSEYPCVVTPVSYAHYSMLKRGLIYTAVTRAKRLCVMIGERRALAKAIKDPESRNRNSTLVDRILDPAISGELF